MVKANKPVTPDTWGAAFGGENKPAPVKPKAEPVATASAKPKVEPVAKAPVVKAKKPVVVDPWAAAFGGGGWGEVDLAALVPKPEPKPVEAPKEVVPEVPIEKPQEKLSEPVVPKHELKTEADILLEA